MMGSCDSNRPSGRGAGHAAPAGGRTSHSQGRLGLWACLLLALTLWAVVPSAYAQDGECRAVTGAARSRLAARTVASRRPGARPPEVMLAPYRTHPARAHTPRRHVAGAALVRGLGRN